MVVGTVEREILDAGELDAGEVEASVADSRVALAYDQDLAWQTRGRLYPDGIVRRHQGEVRLALSLEDAQLVPAVLREGGVPVHVIRARVQQRRNLEARRVHVVELERRDLEDENPRGAGLVEAARQGPPRVPRHGVGHA